MIGVMGALLTHSGYIPLLADKTILTGATLASLVVNKPSDVASGDLLLSPIMSDTTHSFSGDTGWTENDEEANANVSMRLASKTAGVSEPGSYTFTSGAALSKVGGIFAYRSSLLHAVATRSRGSAATSLSVTGVTAAKGKLVLFFAYKNTGGVLTVTPPAGFTLVPGSASVSGNMYFTAYEKPDVAAGATGSLTVGLSGTPSGQLVAYLISLKGVDTP